jgi:predicted RNA polymerase sigma factor
VTQGATCKAIEAVWRIESARLIAGLVRMVRDVGLAEDLAQEALVTALEHWPQKGLPHNPGAWLMATARNRAIDQLRRHQMLERKQEAIEEHASRNPSAPDSEAAIDEDVGDDLLRLLGGLTTQEIARAFLVSEPTIAQRIVKAKRTLSEARVPFGVPRGAELTARLPSVLEVIYLIFNEGYAAMRGDDWMRTELCDDALRLGRILAGLVPGEAEVHGLVALMELHASRAGARLGPSGAPILLLDQDRARWDHLLIRRGLAALARAEILARPLGPYALQAAIAACHARARTSDETDWKRIVGLYNALVELTRSPVVELNCAVAVPMAFGPAAGLELVEALVDEPALRAYHLLPSIRGDFLMRLGRVAEARADFERAASLAQNTRERELLLSRVERSREAGRDVRHDRK